MRRFAGLAACALTVSTFLCLAACTKKEDAADELDLGSLSLAELFVVFDEYREDVVADRKPKTTSTLLWAELESRWPEDEEDFIRFASETRGADLDFLVIAALESGRDGKVAELVEAGAFRKKSSFKSPARSLSNNSRAVCHYFERFQASLSDDEIADFIVRLKGLEPEYSQHVDKMLEDLPQDRQARIKHKMK